MNPSIRLLGGFVACFIAPAAIAQIDPIATVRHAPAFNGDNRIEGSVQQLLGENVTLDGALVVTGDLLVPGTPRLRINGRPTFAGTIIGNGNPLPDDFKVTLSGNVSLGHLRTRTDPAALPPVPSPPTPSGTRSVTLFSRGQSYGDPQTLRNLTVSGSAGPVAVPPGTYGNIVVNGGGCLRLGVFGATIPSPYHLENLILTDESLPQPSEKARTHEVWDADGKWKFSKSCLLAECHHSLCPLRFDWDKHKTGPARDEDCRPDRGDNVPTKLEVVGPILLTVGHNVTIKGQAGTTNHPEWFQLRIANGGLTLDGRSVLSGHVTAPSGTVTIRGKSCLVGSVKCDQLVLDGSSCLRKGTGIINRPPIGNDLEVSTVEGMPASITLTGSDPDGDALNFILLTAPIHGVLGGVAPNLVYRPSPNYRGADSFLFAVDDGSETSLPAIVSIAVEGVTAGLRVDAGIDQTNRQDQATRLTAIITGNGGSSGATTAIEWSSKGPGNAFFSDRTATNTTVMFSVPGEYVLTATASNGSATSQDQVVITVTPPNIAPMVSAGHGQLVYLPSTATLNGTVQDDATPAGASVTVEWTLVSGPGTVSFGNTDSAITSVNFSAPGNYILRLTADDSELTNSAQVTVAARNPAENVAPIVNAGPDKTVGLTNAVTLCGAVTDDTLPVGAPLSTAWTVVSGPGTVIINDAAATNTQARFSALGTYVLRLTASDTALQASDDLSITVYPFNNPPWVNAGEDQTIVVPDPALLSDDGSLALAPRVELSTSLASLSHWNNAIGQPGFTGTPTGATSVRGSRNGLTLSGTNLFASGLFKNAGGQSVKGIARWDGRQWFPLFDPRPNSLTNEAAPPIGLAADFTEWVGPIAARGDEVFAAGTLDNLPDSKSSGAITTTARWDGERWRAWEYDFHPLNVVADVQDVAMDSNDVYVVGYFSIKPELPDGTTNVSHHIARWTGTNWLGVGPEGVTDVRGYSLAAPYAVAVGKSGEVYVGGQFFMATPSGVASNIVKWDGKNWSTLGLGISGCTGFACKPVVHAMTVADDGSLYAVGNFGFVGGVAANNVARWDGTNWSALAGITGNGTDGQAFAVAARGTEVFVGGNFGIAGGFPARSIARWNGQFWSQLGPGPTNGVAGDVLSLAVDNTGLYVSGDFTSAGGSPAAGISKWEFAQPPARGAELFGTATDDGLPTDASLSFLWSKVSGPGDVTFANATNALTTARFGAVGTYVLRLAASDTDLTGSDELTIDVIANQPPVVTANASGTVGMNESFALAGTVSDDGLPANASVVYRWSVVNAPINAIVFFQNPGATNTTVRMDRVGVYHLRLTANDSQFSSGADVIVTVQSANSPPTANLHSYTSSVTLPAAGYVQADVVDDGLPSGVTNILWSMVSGPASVAFSNATAGGTPVYFTTSGTYRIRLLVSDTELAVTADFEIAVSGPSQPPFTGNDAPTVDAGPDRTVIARRPFTLSGSAADDDGLPTDGALLISWSASNNVDRVYFNDTGDPTTTAIVNTPGVYILRLTASDGQFSTSDEAILTVVAATNEPPAISAGPDLEITRPQPALLFGAVTDDGLPLAAPLTGEWSKVSGPGEVVFDRTATNLFPLLGEQAGVRAGFTAAGNYVLRLTYSDSQFTGTDDVSIVVHEGINTAPLTDAGADRAVALPNFLALQTTVTDDGLPFGAVQLAWSQVSGPGHAVFTTFNDTWIVGFDTPGEYLLRLTASDGLLTASDDVTVTVYDATESPVVQMVSPLDADILTAPTVVTGTVSSAILQSWTLQYRLKPADDSLSAPGGEGQGEVAAWITLVTESTEVNNASLATFDPTLLLNGIYELQLTATDLVGRTSTTEPFTIIVDRNMKVGHFTLAFNDLTIPVAGIPIQVTRTYDSRDKRVGDFGVGWTLDLRNIRLQKNRHLGRAWDQTSTGGQLPSYCIGTTKPRIVTITFPDGRVQKFQASAVNPNTGLTCQALVPLEYPTMIFEPIGGNTFGTLVPLSEVNGEIIVDEQLIFPTPIPGRSDLISYERLLNPPAGAADNILFDPDLFEFTSQEGYRYILSEAKGLRSVTDPNGNTLTLTTNGITWTNSLSASVGDGQGEVTVTFQRDSLGRITNIVDALGHAMTYNYDTNGDLITFTDRAGNTNGFTYDGKHQLLTLADARGLEAVRNEYDDAGRIIRHLDVNGQRITYAHDLNNRLEIVTNRLGFVTLSEYDGNGNVVRTVAADGGVTTMSYDSNDNLLATVDPLGRTNTFTYDSKDNRTSATDPLGHTTTLTYNDQRRVTSATDARGNTITNRFDTKGNLLSMRDPLGRVISFSYSDKGLPLAMTNSLGQVMRYAYDEQGRLTNEVDALDHGTSYQRDAQGNLLSQATTRTRVDNSIEMLTVSMQYDGLNRLTNTVFPDGSSARTIYNAIGKPAVTIDQLGRQTFMDYDELGRATRTTYPDGHSDGTAYDVEGRRIAATNRLGQVTQYNYDAVGRLFRMIGSDGTTTTNYFDLAGQLIAATDARGFNTFYGYDDAGRSVSVTNALGQVSRSVFDEAGNLTLSIDALGRTNRFFYDALNRRTNTIFADGTTASTFFDELGRRVAETDQNTNTTRFAYDELGRLHFVTNALGKVTEHRYNELGQQTYQIDANHHATTFDYDQLGRRILRTLPGGQYETYAYNVGGLMTGKRDFNGRITTYTYDVMNRLEQKIPDAVTGEPTVSFAYNVLGQRTNMVDASGSTAYRYDVRNRLVEKVKTWAAVGLSVALNYVYDAAGNLTNVASSSPNGTAIAYEHDELSRLSAVDDAHLGRTTYAYDDVGNLAGYALPNGVTSLHAYDALNRLTNLTASVGSVGVAQYLYGLSPAGHRVTAAETVMRASVPQTINRVFSYDATYRLLGESIGGTAGSASAGYSYDDVGNRLTRSTSGFTPGTLDNQSFAFDPNDRLNTDTYDANGNTLFGAGFNQTQADRYDFENRLIERRSTIASFSRTVNIAYDGDGQRVSKTVNGITTFYLVDEMNPTGYAQVLEELAVDGAQLVPFRIYAYGHDLLSQDQLFDTGTNLVWSASFYGTDGHGSARYLTDASGEVTDTYDYDAFGNLIAQTGTTPNLYLYSGEQFDADLGLYYLRARYHNPQTGRFWSTDSFEGIGVDPKTLHKYSYGGNNPANSVDPSGRYSITELSISTGLWGIARSIFGATIGGMTGSLAAGYDSILHGRVSNQEIGQAMTTGFREGAVAAGFLGGIGSLGSIGQFGVSAIGMVYSGIGFLAAYQSYSSGNVAAGDFESAMAAVTALASGQEFSRTVTTASGLTSALENYYAGPKFYQNIRRVPLSQANAGYPPESAPYAGAAVEFETGAAQYFVRIRHTGNIAKTRGGWLATPESVIGKNRAQLKQMFALEGEVVGLQLVKVPSGVRMRAGRAAAQPTWGENNPGNELQYQLLDQIESSNFSEQLIPVNP